MDSYNSIFKHYGIPQEIIDEISLWTHKISFTDALDDIGMGIGNTTNGKLATFPRYSQMTFSYFLGKDYTALQESNFIYSLLTKNRIIPGISELIIGFYVKPEEYRTRCSIAKECSATFHIFRCPRIENWL